MQPFVSAGGITVHALAFILNLPRGLIGSSTGELVGQSGHPAAASTHLPAFITAPGGTDWLMIAMGMFLLLFVLAVGILYLRLHALPDRLAHNKVQLEVTCVLGLLAMFTHMHIFWIAGLLLALIDIPDVITPIKRIAGATEKIADRAEVEREELGERPSGPVIEPRNSAAA